MENQMETKLIYWGSIGDNGKLDGTYFNILG